MDNTQLLLFDEPAIADTGVWCQLSQEIDPGQWAQLCRIIGNLDINEFQRVQEYLHGRRNCLKRPNPDSLRARFKRMYKFDQADAKELPLVKLGCD
ncbi:MAG: hypothetical protein JEZ07_08740 [Phycisphaerae bacterium]|nr:hypothetical protein [Phycisphaerae bacterium]